MRKRAILWTMAGALMLCICLLDAPAWAENELARSNVKYYGAKGDGRTDDTEAIQKAFLEASNAGMLELVFPSGEYVITKAITPTISARGPATIRQRNPEEDIFHWDWAHQVSFSDFVFRGGRTHLSLANPNINSGFIRIEDCRFYKSSGPAIHIREGTASTFTIIQHCEFLGCDQSLVNHTDWATMRDCWIGGGAEKGNMAVIENRGGKMVLEDILGVPNVRGRDQRWVDNYGYAPTCRSFRFGGEGGGFTPVYNFSKYKTQAGGSRVIIEDSWISAESSFKGHCAVYCVEIPNMIVVRDSNVVGVPAIKVAKNIDLKNYFKNVKPGMLKFYVENNIGEFADDIPELLRNPVVVKDEEAAPSQLSEEETRRLLSEAVEFQGKRKVAQEGPGEAGGHKQQTDPAKYIEITYDGYKWGLEDYMDATRDPNSKYLAIAPAGDDIIIMLRVQQHWPHVLVSDIEVDLDQYPYLCWQQKAPGIYGEHKPLAFAVRVIDKETEQMIMLQESRQGLGYRAYDLRKLLGVSGKRTVHIKYYFLATTMTSSLKSVRAKRGEYMVLDFMRFEAE